MAIVRKPQVEKMTGRSYSSIRRDMRRGEFPKSVCIGPRAIGWHLEEIEAWIKAREVAALPPVKRAAPPAGASHQGER